MHTTNQIQITAPFERLFATAANIEHWPEILPHYRWVKVMHRQGPRVSVEMAASHIGIPMWWKAVQTPLPQERRIHFTHIGGITKGMEVDWTFTKIPSSSPSPTRGEGTSEKWLVEIKHDFQPQWPGIGQWFAEKIVCGVFVQQVANKTLRRIKQLLESSPEGRSR